MKRALIFGITGMDGSHLADFLLSKGYEVHGVRRRSSVFNTQRIDHLIDSELANKKFFLHYGDMADSSNVNRLISDIQPDELYELAANSHVKVSFEIPEYTADVDALGALRVMEAVRVHSPHTKVYFASTSECFGGIKENMPKAGFNENSLFYPKSPYGVAKLYGYWISKNFREAYNLFISCGILFNHSSFRRGETFLTRKVTKWLGSDQKQPLRIGNMYAYRDEGHSLDYVKAMWMILQHKNPDDFVVSTGETHSIKEWIDVCFARTGKNIKWYGYGIEEKGYIDNELKVIIDPAYFRPTEVDYLLGDSTKIRDLLGWEPEFSYSDLAQEMVDYDCYGKLPVYFKDKI